MASTNNSIARERELRLRPASRSKSTQRPKRAEHVERLRGTVYVEHTLSRAGADGPDAAYALMRAGAGLGVSALIWLELLFASKFPDASQ